MRGQGGRSQGALRAQALARGTPSASWLYPLAIACATSHQRSRLVIDMRNVTRDTVVTCWAPDHAAPGDSNGSHACDSRPVTPPGDWQCGHGRSPKHGGSKSGRPVVDGLLQKALGAGAINTVTRALHQGSPPVLHGAEPLQMTAPHDLASWVRGPRAWGRKLMSRSIRIRPENCSVALAALAPVAPARTVPAREFRSACEAGLGRLRIRISFICEIPSALYDRNFEILGKEAERFHSFKDSERRTLVGGGSGCRTRSI